MNLDISNILEIFYEAVTFDVFLKFSIVYFFIIWIAILLWVIKDISNRTDNIFLQIISILSILFLTPFWIFIYLLIRPWKTLFEKYYEEIEDNLDLFNQIIEEKNNKCESEVTCFKCREPISHDFKFCPKCKVSLKNECNWCKKLLSSDWKACPYCGKKQKKEKNKK
jgi:RNA polymerase subunit RPABC4/transcription elongation factor Spt4